MAHGVDFLPLARLEVIEAFDWYARRSRRLADEFVAEVDHQAERIAANPFAFPVLHADLRRARLRRFPYGLFFRVIEDRCVVLACFHASRDPRQWQERA
ncbi:MAG: type II toxin-antitoxin system RelE/ParE family toxin [Alphaproteobacteria bacterium]|nr:type II toxin-antitoxin system RelE/ParE family toxin [Alphaproteobacteria bacterium]